MSEFKKYYIRFSRKSDFDALIEFYQANGHPNVRARKAETLKRQAKEGSVILIEDEDGKIVATSITFSHRARDRHGVERVRWQEIGSTRSVLNHYPGLFDAMVTMQVLRTALVEPPENLFVARMRAVPMQRIAERLGWRRMEDGPPPDLIKAKFHTVSQHFQDQVSDWYACGLEGLPVMAKWMAKVFEQNFILEHRDTKEKIEIDFSRSSFFRMFGAEIRELAKKCLGNADNINMKQNMREYRDKWLRSFYR